MLLPPPNVTGVLHLGHALTLAIQDTIARYRRMKGDSVHWIPGMDHAGIATQTVFQRRYGYSHLPCDLSVEDQKKYRQDFENRMKEFVEKHKSCIQDQMYRLGVSVDWDATYYTLDTERTSFVEDAFIQFFEAGLIYRQTRLVNWCCHLRTAISDIEIDVVNIENGPIFYKLPGDNRKAEVGLLHSIAYPLFNDQLGRELIVSTTRLETMFGDVALAIHPEDERYHEFIGSHVIHPLFPLRKLPVITSRLVDRTMGMGVLKITPAHDKVDYEIAREYELPLISVIDESGRLTHACGEMFSGLDRFDSRQLIKESLIEKGFYRGSKQHNMSLTVCSRTGDILETLLKPQW